MKRTAILIVLIVTSLLLSSCQTEYVCPNGQIVNSLEEYYESSMLYETKNSLTNVFDDKDRAQDEADAIIKAQMSLLKDVIGDFDENKFEIGKRATSSIVSATHAAAVLSKKYDHNATQKLKKSAKELNKKAGEVLSTLSGGADDSSIFATNMSDIVSNFATGLTLSAADPENLQFVQTV